MPVRDVARGMFLTCLAARTTAVLVPLVIFMAMLFHIRDRINVPD